MAAKLGGDDDDAIVDINITPFVDIILVVLIIFMLTANLIAKQSIEVELPEAATGEGTEPTTLALTLQKDGVLFLNGVPTSEEKLKGYLPELVDADPDVQAIIAADQAISHGRVIRLIDLIRQLGVYKFALNIDPVAPDADIADVTEVDVPPAGELALSITEIPTTPINVSFLIDGFEIEVTITPDGGAPRAAGLVQGRRPSSTISRSRNSPSCRL